MPSQSVYFRNVIRFTPLLRWYFMCPSRSYSALGYSVMVSLSGDNLLHHLEWCSLGHQTSSWFSLFGTHTADTRRNPRCFGFVPNIAAISSIVCSDTLSSTHRTPLWRISSGVSAPFHGLISAFSILWCNLAIIVSVRWLSSAREQATALPSTTS